MIRGTKRPVPEKKLDLRAAIHNRFDVEVIDAATGAVKQRARAFNVICDAYWSRLFNSSNSGATWNPQTITTYILYGRGAGTPAASDTALFDRIAGVSIGNADRTFFMNRVTGVAGVRRLLSLSPSTAVGETITEVGMGYDSSHCTTHAMLEDMNGNPISIEKTDTDIINIYGTVYIHWPDGGWYNGAVNFCAPASNTTFNVTYSDLVWILTGSAAFGTVLLLASNPGKHIVGTGNAVSNTQNNTAAVDAANKKITFKGRWDVDSANGPIRAFFLYVNSNNVIQAFVVTAGAWFTPPAITGEAVGTGDGSATEFDTAFPAAAGGTVLVNGVADASATLRPGPVDGNHMEQYFNPLIDAGVSASGAPLRRRYGQTSSSNEVSLDPDNNYLAVNFQKSDSAITTAPVENPFSSLGLASFVVTNANTDSGGNRVAYKIQASDDCAAWIDVGDTGQMTYGTSVTLPVPANCKTKRYFRFVRTDPQQGTGYANFHLTAVGDFTAPAHNIIFSTPPAAGAVITANYAPDCIAKDSDHVFDYELTLTVGEYQEV